MLSGILYSQTLLTGQITDENGEPLPGASVILLETRKGVSANETGIYKMENLAPGAYTVEVSFVGYQKVQRVTKVVAGFDKAILHVQLKHKIVTLNEMTVSATRAGLNSPFTYSTIKKEALEKQNMGQDVPFLLRWSPSAVVTSDAGAGFGYTGIRIRGTDPTRINVTINGVPLNDSESQGVFWVDLPDFASSVEDVQIQRGVGTSTNGAGAFGASINMNTSQINKESYASLSSAIGSFNTQRANLQFGTGLLNDKFTLDGRFSRTTSDGYIDRADVDLKSFYFSGAYVGEKSVFRLNVFSGTEVTYQAWNGVPAQFIDRADKRTFNVSGIEKGPLDPHDNEVDDYTQTHYQALLNHQFSRNLDINLAVHYTKGKGFFEQYKAQEAFGDYGLEDIHLNTGFADLDINVDSLLNFYNDERISVSLDTLSFFLEAPPWIDTLYQVTYKYDKTDLIRRRWLDNDFYGATWSLNYIKNDNRLQMTLGGAWNKYIGDHFGEILWADILPEGIEPNHRYYSSTGEKTDFNVFAKFRYNISPYLNVFTDLQYRKVDYIIEGTDNDLRDISMEDNLTFLNPKIGLSYQLTDRSNLYASFAVANREPNRNDYTDAPIDQRPKHETLYNTEIGFRQNWKKAAVSVNFYHMLYQDQLVLTGQINDVGAAIRTNVPDSYRAGIELVGGFDITKKLSLSANATYSQNKIKSFTEYRDNWDTWGQEIIEHGETDIAFSPNVIVGTDLTYDFFKGNRQQSNTHLSISLLNKYVSQQFIDNTSNENTIIDPYFFSDLRIRVAIGKKFLKEASLTFLVRNLFDSRYETNAWTYRFVSAGYDPTSFDKYARAEGDGTYNLTGYYPQAGRNYLLGLTFKF